jgi:hypothetical protein
MSSEPAAGPSAVTTTADPRVDAYDGAIVPDPQNIITGGHENTTARQISIRRGETVNAPALVEMLRQIVANNRAGGWRKLKREPG